MADLELRFEFEITRRPLTIVFAPCLRANSSTSSANTSTSTFVVFSSARSASLRKMTVFSTEYIVASCAAKFITTPTTTLVEIPAGWRRTSTPPDATRFSLPGKMATARVGARRRCSPIVELCSSPWRRVERTGSGSSVPPPPPNEYSTSLLPSDQHARQMFGERHAQGFNHLVRRIDEDDVMALVRPGEVAPRIRADDPALQAELLEVALDDLDGGGVRTRRTSRSRRLARGPRGRARPSRRRGRARRLPRRADDRDVGFPNAVGGRPRVAFLSACRSSRPCASPPRFAWRQATPLTDRRRRRGRSRRSVALRSLRARPLPPARAPAAVDRRRDGRTGTR